MGVMDYSFIHLNWDFNVKRLKNLPEVLWNLIGREACNCSLNSVVILMRL